MTADLGDRQDADALGQRIRPVAASLLNVNYFLTSVTITF
jgi:hypothetical protein